MAARAKSSRQAQRLARLRKLAEESLAAFDADWSEREDASWFGKTGLSEELERDLPNYLRMELGMLLPDPRALKAQELTYHGIAFEGSTVIHYSTFRNEGKTECAYIEVRPDGGSCTGWGGRKLPRNVSFPRMPPRKSKSRGEGK